jgi:SAM-dependent methyltransferase
LDWSRKVHPNASGHGKGLFGNEKDIPVPPRSLLVGPADAFVDVALTTMGRMIMAGLRPEHDVLDIGCGVGRTARYLCGFLEDGARYEGFDVREDLVAWCQSNITPRFRNFHFQVAALFNSNYRPDPSLPSAAEFTFPYPDRSFDFVFAHSMFTHLQPDVSNNYLREIHRVLRPGGISYTTWVLINDDDPSLFAHATQRMHRDPSGTFAVRRVTDPDALVAYTEQFVRGAHSSSGLSIVEPVHPGFRLQDVVVAVK